MAILERFNDIIKANINVLLDKLEDPEKMIDQYLENMMKDLAEVKQSTAEVIDLNRFEQLANAGSYAVPPA